MRGTDARTGKPVSGLDHLRQSIQDILTTPIGTRVMRRDYGSRLFELVDAPLNTQTRVQIYAATAQAIDRWEPRFHVERVQILAAGDGRIELDLDGRFAPGGVAIKLEGIVVEHTP